MSAGDDPIERPDASAVTKTVAPRPHESALDDDALFQPGTQLGRYVIGRALGAGGMSLVYEAFDHDLDRRIAIKVMRTKYWDQAGQLRALREGQAMAKLSHPNVVAVHDVGAIGDQTFIAMELVDGVTLREWLLREPRTWRAILDVLVQVGRGLAAAHAAGLIHRDIKPSNVLVDESGRARVTDFGIARPMRVDADGETVAEDIPTPQVPATRESSTRRSALGVDLTRTGAVLGTPAYMAPEQRKGKSGVLADQYSFCLMAQEALFDARRDTSTDTEEDATAERPSAPRWLRKAIARGLAHDPAARYPSMDALLSAMAADPSSRRRAVAASALGAALIATAIVALATRSNAATPCDGVDAAARSVWSVPIASWARGAFIATGRSHASETFARVDRVVRDRLDAWAAKRRDACAATRVRGEQSEHVLDLRMRCLDRRLAELAATTTLFATRVDGSVVDNALAAAAAADDLSACDDVAALEQAIPPPADPVTRTAADRLGKRLDGVNAQAMAGLYADALEAVRPLAAEAERLGWAPVHARALYWLGRLQSYAGQSEQSAATLQQAMQRAGDARDDTLMADAGLELIYVLGYELARSDEALRIGELVTALVRRAGNHPSREGELMDRIGIVLWAKRDLAGAQRHFEHALALYANASDNDRLTASALTNLGNVLADQGNYDEARKMYERELAITERVDGATHPSAARGLANLGTVLTSLGRYDEAQRVLERALAIWEASYGDAHPMIAMVTNALGTLLFERGDAAGALRYCMRAQAAGEATLPDGHPVRAYHLICVGDAQAKLERHAEAAAAYERALAIRVAAGSEPSELAAVQLGLAKARWEIGGQAGRRAARELAITARDAFRAAGAAQATRLADAEAWLLAHR